MGLDMYLFAKRPIRDYADESVEVNARGHIGNVIDITSEIAYWRKANHIHGWFVRNVQNGKDDCREYLVERDHISNLLAVCKYSLDNRKKIESGEYENQLEPTQGFFFGGYLIDEFYWADIQKTEEICQQMLSNDDFWKYNRVFYQSSW